MWVAHAVWQADGGGLTVPSAQASLGMGADALTSTREPPVPAYQPTLLPPPPVPAVETTMQLARLRERSARWEFLDDQSRRDLDAAAARSPGRRAGWSQVVVEGTGEPSGSAKDVTFSSQRHAGREWLPHFVIGNGTRSGDGVIESTGRPLDGDRLVVSMVGDFSRSAPTAAQLRSVTELVDYARAKTGMIPVRVGDASRAPVTASVLDAAYNASISIRPDPPPDLP